MSIPMNAAAEQIVRAQSIITDLTTQGTEIQSAIGRQQALIEALTPHAEWGEPPPEPEPDPSPAE